jgi:acetyl esterase/lipase
MILRRLLPLRSTLTRRTGLLAAALALLTGCSPTAVLNTLVSRSSYRSEPDLPYGAGPRHRLDVYHPVRTASQPSAAPGADAARPPIVVFFYGGNWSSGERADYRFVGESLASAGALTVIPDYRLTPEVRYPDFLHDSAAALAWVFEHAEALGGDPQRVYVMGHSAGAYNAAMLALDARWTSTPADPGRPPLAGFIGIAGPYDFLPIGLPDTQFAFRWPDTPRDTQPVEHVSARAPRTLLIAALKDDLVDPTRNTVRLGERLLAVGAPVTVRLLDSVNHVTVIAAMANPLTFLAPVRGEVLRFVGLK